MRNLAKILNNQSGVGLIAITAAISGLVIVAQMIVHNTRIGGSSNTDYRTGIHYDTTSKRILSTVGFAVSNNLIICKEGDKSLCKWNELVDGENFDAKKFGLLPTKNRYDKNGNLVFKIDRSFYENLNDKDAELKIKLVRGGSEDSFSRVLGEVTEEEKFYDKDIHFVQAEVSIKDSKQATLSKKVANFRRPLVFIKNTIRPKECVSSCYVGAGENDNPSCRSVFAIDENSETEVLVTTRNMGPGTLYGLDLARTASFVDGTRDKKRAIKVPIDGYLLPNKVVRWTDTVKCKTFVRVVENVTTVENDETDNSRTSGTAGSTSRTVTSTTTNTSVSQHAINSGSISYSLAPTEELSSLEPFRMVSNVDSRGQVNGQETLVEKDTTVTVTVKVVPPH